MRSPTRRGKASNSRTLARGSSCPPLESDFALGVPFGYQPELKGSARIGVMAHIYHAELTPEIEQVITHLGEQAQVMITTDSVGKRLSILDVFRGWKPGQVEVRIVENRGRDISAKLTAFQDRFEYFDLILFLHSKKSTHSSDGTAWRNTLLSGLAGSPDVVNSILTLFEVAPQTGMVFCQHHEAIRRFVGWGCNFKQAKEVAHRWGLRLNRRGVMDFPSGSMFWARPAALQPLLALGLTAADFPPEQAQLDGTMAHAIERLFALSTELAGFRWLKVAAPDHYHYRETIVTPCADSQLGVFAANHQRRLMETMVR